MSLSVGMSKFYMVNGNQLIIDDMDRDPSDQVVLTK